MVLAGQDPTLMIDVVRGVISNRKTGESFAMPAGMAQLYLQTIEAQQKMAVLEKRCETDSRCKALKASGLRVDRATARALSKRLLGRSAEPLGQREANAPAASAVDLCSELSKSIYFTTLEYREQLGNQLAALSQMLESLAVGDIGRAGGSYLA